MKSIIHSVYFSKNRLKISTYHHDCHQIIFILKGEVEIYVNGEKYKAKSGNIVIFSRYKNHPVTVKSNEYERFVLRINPMLHNEYNKIYSLLLNRPDGFNNLLEFKRMFNLILTEYKSSDSFSEEMLLSLINQLLITIFRSLPSYNSHFDAQDFETILKLQKELENNYSLNHSLEELAKKYNCSVSSLSHQF